MWDLDDALEQEQPTSTIVSSPFLTEYHTRCYRTI